MQTKNLLKIALSLGLISIGSVQAVSSISNNNTASNTTLAEGGAEAAGVSGGAASDTADGASSTSGSMDGSMNGSMGTPDSSSTGMGSPSTGTDMGTSVAPEVTVDPANRGSIDPALRDADPKNVDRIDPSKSTDPLSNTPSTTQDTVTPTTPSDPMLTSPTQQTQDQLNKMKEPVQKSDEWPHTPPANGVPVEPTN